MTCPNTDTRVRTGVSMTEETLRNLDIEGREVPCEKCGERHVWTKENAFFDESL